MKKWLILIIVSTTALPIAIVFSGNNNHFNDKFKDLGQYKQKLAFNLPTDNLVIKKWNFVLTDIACPDPLMADKYDVLFYYFDAKKKIWTMPVSYNNKKVPGQPIIEKFLYSSQEKKLIIFFSFPVKKDVLIWLRLNCPAYISQQLKNHIFYRRQGLEMLAEAQQRQTFPVPKNYPLFNPKMSPNKASEQKE